MANVEVKLTKEDLAKFLEEIATIKAKKRTKLYKLTEMASMFLDDYEEDKKGTTLSELTESVQKVLDGASELQEELKQQIMAIYQGICDEAIERKPVEKKTKKTPKKKEEQPKAEQPKAEPKAEPKKEEKELFPKDVEIGDDSFKKIVFKNMAEVQKAYLNKELYLLSHWGELDKDFDIEDFDSLGVVDTLQLINGYDLMQVVFVGDKTAICVSNYNEVNTTLLQEDLDNMTEQRICFYEKVSDEE